MSPLVSMGLTILFYFPVINTIIYMVDLETLISYMTLDELKRIQSIINRMVQCKEEQKRLIKSVLKDEKV